MYSPRFVITKDRIHRELSLTSARNFGVYPPRTVFTKCHLHQAWRVFTKGRVHQVWAKTTARSCIMGWLTTANTALATRKATMVWHLSGLGRSSHRLSHFANTKQTLTTTGGDNRCIAYNSLDSRRHRSGVARLQAHGDGQRDSPQLGLLPKQP